MHEQILPALRRANVPVRWTDLSVWHTGYVDPALRARKLERPDDPFILFNLGAIAVERREWHEALGLLEGKHATNCHGAGPTPTPVEIEYACSHE